MTRKKRELVRFLLPLIFGGRAGADAPALPGSGNGGQAGLFDWNTEERIAYDPVVGRARSSGPVRSIDSRENGSSEGWPVEGPVGFDWSTEERIAYDPQTDRTGWSEPIGRGGLRENYRSGGWTTGQRHDFRAGGVHITGVW